MGKLLVVLLVGLYLTLKFGGDDPGQLRPGLANAVVEPAAPKAIVAPVETQTLAAADTQAAKPAKATASEIVVTAATGPATPRKDVVAVAYSPDPAPVTPARQPDKVFTLSVLPGQENALAEALPQVQTEAAAPAVEPEVWYVTGRSVNVRLDPSTEAPIVGQLTRGDAALMLADNGAGWAQVTIEGDGMTGYVSMDFLSPVAP